MHSVIRGLAWGLGWCCWAAAAGAVVRGATDTFEDGTTNGWSTGFQNPLQPVNVGSGGPAGAGDNYLQASASGLAGPGGRLVVIGGPQWRGDYLAAGVTAITMDVRNFGPSEVSLRLYFAGANLGSGLTQAFVLPAGGDWQAVNFSLASLLPNGLAALPELTAVTDLRLYHDAGAPQFPGENIAAPVGIDNVAAVPEPAPAALLTSGLAAWAALGALRKRRRRRR